MPTFYNFTRDGLEYSFDNTFVPTELFQEGNLWVWGYNESSSLGINSAVLTVSTPVTVFSGGLNWKKISTNWACSGGIKSDGTLWIWGPNDNRRLGTNSTVSAVSTPVTTFAGGTNWRDLTCDRNCTAAIKTDGTLWVWGGCAAGSLGNGQTTGSVSTPVTTFAGGTNWKQVSGNSGSLKAIKTDGTLWVWGSSIDGQLGNGQTTGSVSTPITTFAGGTNWKEVYQGKSNFAYAIKTDGTLWCWGYNYNGYLGLGETDFSSRSTPVTTFSGGTNWKQVSCSYKAVGAIKTDGTLWTWGYDNYGALGRTTVGALRNTPVTTFAGGTNWADTPTTNPEDLYTINVGRGNSGAIKTDGTLWLWGSNYFGHLANGNLNDVSTPITTFAGGTNWKQISFMDSFSATSAIKTDGTLWTWGYNGNGQLGINVGGGSRSTPVTTFAGGTNWKQVSSGNYHTAAIKTDGTLWLWGQNSNGQLGINVVGGSRSTPVTTFAGGINWKQVYLGSTSSAAIKTDGTLWTWGDNIVCSLGINVNGGSYPTPITTFAGGTNWKQVSDGSAIKTDGTLWVWSGSQGNNSTAIISTPVTTFAGGTNWKQVSTGNNGFLAIKTDGTLWSWGDGISAALNRSGVASSLTPVTTFAGGTNWVQCSAGAFNGMALKSDGTLWSWGSFSIGIGIPRNSFDAVPRQTFSEYSNTWKYVSIGLESGASIKNDGTLWTWGGVNSPLLGSGQLLPSSITPVTTFQGGTNWKSVSYTRSNLLALTYIENYLY